jgi:CheY-like chemotaxis protein
VYLPALPAAATSPPAASREPARGRETVLVVDDNETLLDVLQETLRRLGYRTLRATNGREAVQIAQSYKGDIHVTLLDMAMPVMGGAEAYPLLKETRPNMRIIICTGVHTDPQAEQLLKSGVDSILHKPFRPTTLAQTIRDALSGQAVAGEPA